MKKTSRSTKRCSNKKSARFIPSAKKGLITLSHWLMALALLPLVWACLKSLIYVSVPLGQAGFSTWWIYGLGIGVYLLIDRFLTQPMTLYVVGHELTHAISGFISGAKVHSLKASSRGGEVRLSKTNTIISLSPYIVPLYALLVILIYAIVKQGWNTRELLWAFQFLLGACLSFHWAMTIRAVHLQQPDLKGKGFFLSVVLIVIGNSLVVGLMLVGLFGRTPTLKQYAQTLYFNTLAAGQQIFFWGKQLWIP